MTAAREGLVASVLGNRRSRLGEGPHWDDARGELVYVDILSGLVQAWSPGVGPTWVMQYDDEVGAAIPRKRGGYVIAVGHELLARTMSGHEEVIARVEVHLADNRFNDCRCDPAGRLWAGTMSRSRHLGTAALYRLEPTGEIAKVLDGTTISNGIGWSPAADRMYFIDSPTQRLDVFDFESSSGRISNRRTIATVDPADGMPDGLTVDEDGGIWVCLFGGGAVRRYAPDGTLDEHIGLPATHPTCPVFGGEDLRTLFITTTRHRLSEEELVLQPKAGAVLALRPGARGLRGSAFAG